MRLSAVRLAFAAVVASPAMLEPAAAQQWNDARTMALVSRATDRRARQLADTGLTDYTATAIGSLTFLAQVGEGFPDPPKVVKADQIGLEVYWRAPNHSKQLILGRRDTLLLPTDIEYHRDHLGIVQNNFPSIIRLGDGDEVRDVPHPLSAAGLQAYDFSIRDSMRIQVPGQVIEVYEVRLRPKNERAPAAVGAVYLSTADAQVVRMSFSFTRSALIDPQLDDVAIVLDNALIEERFWLPRRQEIEIRRSGTWLDFPARGIIRGGFEICCYRINTDQPEQRFAGPEIEFAPPERRAAWQFPEPLRSIVPPDLATASGEDVARVQAQARELVSEAALARARTGAVLARSVSDVVRYNRTEGLSLGAGVRRGVGTAVDLSITGRYGLGDGRAKGSIRGTWRATPRRLVHLTVFDELRDASDVQEVSGLRNSIGAQEFGADFTELYRARGVDVRVEHRLDPAGRLSLGISLGREHALPTSIEGIPGHGTFRPAMPLDEIRSWRGDMTVSLAPTSFLGGALGVDLTGRLRRVDAGDSVSYPARVTARLRFERPAGPGRLVSESFGGLADDEVSIDLLRAGGPVTAPGYRAHQFTSRALLSQRIEWQVAVPFPGVPLGRWGRSPATATLAPLASIVVQEELGSLGNRRAVGYPSVGMGLLLFFDLIRIDVARGLRNGRWMFGVDLTRDLWRIL
jgi:hypothetical protein